jgi:DNA-binding MarR family transcriptional regulator
MERMPMVRGYRGPHDRFGGAARFRLLGALRERDGMSVSEIAEMVGVDQPRASRLVNESAERGLVTRRADEKDARRSVVEITAAGRAMLDTANASRRSAVQDAVAGFTPDERATFADLLTRFVAGWKP